MEGRSNFPPRRPASAPSRKRESMASRASSRSPSPARKSPKENGRATRLKTPPPLPGAQVVPKPERKAIESASSANSTTEDSNEDTNPTYTPFRKKKQTKKPIFMVGKDYFDKPLDMMGENEPNSKNAGLISPSKSTLGGNDSFVLEVQPSMQMSDEKVSYVIVDGNMDGRLKREYDYLLRTIGASEDVVLTKEKLDEKWRQFFRTLGPKKKEPSIPWREAQKMNTEKDTKEVVDNLLISPRIDRSDTWELAQKKETEYSVMYKEEKKYYKSRGEKVPFQAPHTRNQRQNILGTDMITDPAIAQRLYMTLSRFYYSSAHRKKQNCFERWIQYMELRLHIKMKFGIASGHSSLKHARRYFLRWREVCSRRLRELMLRKKEEAAQREDVESNYSIPSDISLSSPDIPQHVKERLFMKMLNEKCKTDGYQITPRYFQLGHRTKVFQSTVETLAVALLAPPTESHKSHQTLSDVERSIPRFPGELGVGGWNIMKQKIEHRKKHDNTGEDQSAEEKAAKRMEEPSSLSKLLKKNALPRPASASSSRAQSSLPSGGMNSPRNEAEVEAEQEDLSVSERLEMSLKRVNEVDRLVRGKVRPRTAPSVRRVSKSMDRQVREREERKEIVGKEKSCTSVIPVSSMISVRSNTTILGEMNSVFALLPDKSKFPQEANKALRRIMSGREDSWDYWGKTSTMKKHLEKSTKLGIKQSPLIAPLQLALRPEKRGKSSAQKTSKSQGSSRENTARSSSPSARTSSRPMSAGTNRSSSSRSPSERSTIDSRRAQSTIEEVEEISDGDSDLERQLDAYLGNSRSPSAKRPRSAMARVHNPSRLVGGNVNRRERPSSASGRAILSRNNPSATDSGVIPTIGTKSMESEAPRSILSTRRSSRNPADTQRSVLFEDEVPERSSRPQSASSSRPTSCTSRRPLSAGPRRPQSAGSARNFTNQTQLDNDSFIIEETDVVDTSMEDGEKESDENAAPANIPALELSQVKSKNESYSVEYTEASDSGNDLCTEESSKGYKDPGLPFADDRSTTSGTLSERRRPLGENRQINLKRRLQHIDNARNGPVSKIIADPSLNEIGGEVGTLAYENPETSRSSVSTATTYYMDAITSCVEMQRQLRQKRKEPPATMTFVPKLYITPEQPLNDLDEEVELLPPYTQRDHDICYPETPRDNINAPFMVDEIPALKLKLVGTTLEETLETAATCQEVEYEKVSLNSLTMVPFLDDPDAKRIRLKTTSSSISQETYKQIDFAEKTHTAIVNVDMPLVPQPSRMGSGKKGFVSSPIKRKPIVVRPNIPE